jgi:hypothetical protein
VVEALISPSDFRFQEIELSQPTIERRLTRWHDITTVMDTVRARVAAGTFLNVIPARIPGHLVDLKSLLESKRNSSTNPTG